MNTLVLYDKIMSIIADECEHCRLRESFIEAECSFWLIEQVVNEVPSSDNER